MPRSASPSARSTRRRHRPPRPGAGHGRRAVALGVTTALAILGAVVTGPVPAQAATRTSVQSVAASLQAGTLVDDITTGRVSVRQLVDTAEAAWASGPHEGATRPDRDALTREATSEVRALRSSDGLRAPTTQLDVTAAPGGGLTASVDSVAVSDGWKHFWHKVGKAITPHLQTIRLTPAAMRIIMGAAGGIGAAFFCAIPGVGTLACGLFYALIGTLVGVWSAGLPCGNRDWYAMVPDVWNSHCG